MTLQQEFNSWLTPTAVDVQPAPEIGSKAPSSERLTFPHPDGKPTIITFLRHCGCPFAEKSFLTFRALANTHPNINFIAISHSTSSSTDNWVISLGGSWSVEVIVDESRELYAQWGLGTSSAWHVLNPWSLWGAYSLGKGEGIWNRPTESGTRWQTAGSWAVDGEGVVRWGGAAKAADEVQDFKEAVRVLEGK
ncbi:Thioredoxin-like fold protein [Rutstroemia sp. NJR-2017a BVV2]|nr:Thioredoxin-like fold protein [Rutstroemia sp. NJR-2017a BVV2]